MARILGLVETHIGINNAHSGERYAHRLFNGFLRHEISSDSGQASEEDGLGESEDPERPEDPAPEEPSFGLPALPADEPPAASDGAAPVLAVFSEAPLDAFFSVESPALSADDPSFDDASFDDASFSEEAAFLYSSLR
jgi:hypothetical protein